MSSTKKNDKITTGKFAVFVPLPGLYPVRTKFRSSKFLLKFMRRLQGGLDSSVGGATVLAATTLRSFAHVRAAVLVTIQ